MAFQSGGGGLFAPLPPFGYAYDEVVGAYNLVMENSIRLLLAKLLLDLQQKSSFSEMYLLPIFQQKFSIEWFKKWL